MLWKYRCGNKHSWCSEIRDDHKGRRGLWVRYCQIRSTFTGTYTRGENDMQANGTAREKKGIEIRKCIYSRMELRLKYRVCWAKRLQRSLKKLLKHKIEMISKGKPS